MVFSKEEQEIYDLTINLLTAIRKGDIETYKLYSSEHLTAIEPETSSLVVEGLDFHVFFLSHTQPKEFHIELVNPVIKVYSDTAYIAYTLIENKFFEGKFNLKNIFETRIYHKEQENWKMVHFHRN